MDAVGYSWVDLPNGIYKTYYKIYDDLDDNIGTISIYYENNFLWKSRIF